MAARFLLVGLSTDGNSNSAILPKDTKELNYLLGANYIERFYLSPSASSTLLTYEPWRTPLNKVNSEKDYLFAPYMDTTNPKIMGFGPIGGSGNQLVDLQYHPYLGKSDLRLAAHRFLSLTNQMPYVARLGGERASVTIGDWIFEAKYAGYKYNYVGLSSNGSSLTIFGLDPNYNQKSYSIQTLTPLELNRSIAQDYLLGTLPIYCAQQGSGLIPSGTHWLTGGTDGEFTADSITTFLDQITVPPDVSHIVFLGEISSGIIASLDTYYERAAVPRMMLLQAPGYYSDAEDWVNDMFTNLPYRHNMMSAFVGTTTHTFDGREVERYAVESSAIAFAKAGGFNLTNIPVDANTFYPILSETDLNLVKGAGFVPLMRYINNDISVYEGTTMHNENSFLYSSKTAEISAIAYDYCVQFLGTLLPEGHQPAIVTELNRRLSRISFITIQEIEVYKELEEMWVNIAALLPNEILEISFTIKNR